MTIELFDAVILTALTTVCALSVASLLFAWAAGDLEVIEAKDQQVRHQKE